MLKIALGAEFNSEQMFKDVAALASKYKGVQLHTHVAENPVSPHTFLVFESALRMTASVCFDLLRRTYKKQDKAQNARVTPCDNTCPQVHLAD